MDLGIDLEFSHAPGDQLCVLGAEVEDENLSMSRAASREPRKATRRSGPYFLDRLRDPFHPLSIFAMSSTRA